MVQMSPLHEQLRAGLPGLDPGPKPTPVGGTSGPPWPVQIVRCWREALPEPAQRGAQQLRLLMRLALPDADGDPPDVELRWLGTIAGSHYLVLEQERLAP